MCGTVVYLKKSSFFLLKKSKDKYKQSIYHWKR